MQGYIGIRKCKDISGLENYSLWQILILSKDIFSKIPNFTTESKYFSSNINKGNKMHRFILFEIFSFIFGSLKRSDKF